MILYTMKEEWGALKSVLNNRGLGINEKCLYEGIIVLRCTEQSRGIGYK